MDAWDQFQDAPTAKGADPWSQFKDAPGGFREVRAGTASAPSAAPSAEAQAQQGALYDTLARDQRIEQRSPMARLGGVLDAGATASANLIPSIAGSVAAVGAAAFNKDRHAAEQWVHDKIGVKPFTQAGQDAAGRIGQSVEPITNAARKVDDVTGLPVSEALRHTLTLAGAGAGARAVAGEVSLARQARAANAPTAEQVLQRQMGTAGSQGAAAATPDLTNASPALRQAVVKAGKKGVDTEALRRQTQAESVGVQLTEGQAKGDPRLISIEQNMRGAQPKLLERFSEQNKQLVNKLQDVREQIGPDVFTTNAVEHADELIRSYRMLDKSKNADISAKYKALADANGGTLPIDGETFIKQATANLQRENKARFLPPEIKRTLADIAKSTRTVTDPLTLNSARKSGMTFGQFENLRTTLAAASRQAERAGNGNAVGAIAQVRNALENMPLPPEAANLKPLADAARTASRERFEMLAADPAYKAAINKTVRPDLFVRRFVIGGDRDKLEIMRQNLANDPVAGQTISVAAFDHLRNGARISPEWTGNFTQAGFAKTLQQLDPKAKLLFAPDTLETLSNLRDVAGYTQFQPRGSFVNNSNTFVSGVAKYGGDAAAGAANVAFGGVPVGTWTQQAGNKLFNRSRINRMLEPGAGIRKQ